MSRLKRRALFMRVVNWDTPCLMRTAQRLTIPRCWFAVLWEMGKLELTNLFKGYGYKPYFVEGSDPMDMHQQMAGTLDTIVYEIDSIQNKARADGNLTRPIWPMIILRSPKGWTGPKEVDGQVTENHWHSHQVPLSGIKDNAEHLSLLETWMRSYKPEELFDESGRLIETL